ncbi:PAS domain-containing hybrid sensor histidine kinase/response regulator [Geobacter pickeringii]|uniref:PAS domain-containing hybrid sensor histidine kinase/response regulator n=1 Tax=Geobacter pickeringii TaxID=345632 RepID=UPI00068F69D5|nr:PAS domain S-box protein [Geobacter pickeringii]
MQKLPDGENTEKKSPHGFGTGAFPSCYPELQERLRELEETKASLAVANRELYESRELLNSIIESIPTPIFFKNSAGAYENCNRAFSDFLGIPKERIIGATVHDIAPPELAEIYHRADLELMAERGTQVYEAKVRYADGLLHEVIFYKSVILQNGGTLRGLVGVMLDITDRIRAEDALRESERQLRVIFETSQAGIIIVGADGTITFANRKMAEMFGCPFEELVGSRYHDRLHSAEREVGDCRMRRLIAGEIDHVATERHYLRADGSDFWGYLSGKRLENPDGSLHALVGIIADVTELKEAQRALEQEKELLAVTLRSIGDGVISVDTAGRVVLLNAVAEQLCGWKQEEAAGRPLSEVFPIINEKSRESLVNPVDEVLRTGRVVELANHTVLIGRDGTERVIADSAAPICDRSGAILGVVLVFRDMTEKKEAEEELFRARKLESLGVLAGGIAHDFNNMLTGILGNISLARMIVTSDHEAHPLLERAQKASERARDLTQQLLTFSRGGAPVKKVTSLAQLIRESASFALRGSNVRCTFSISDDLWLVDADVGQFSQVINNLVLNADQAMPDGGVVAITAENVDRTAEAGRKVRISFEDTGVGIPEKYLPRIFDPYFSTKQQGSGLGLATVYSIVRNHDGVIRVDSQPGRGTLFVVELPAVEKSTPSEKPAPAGRTPDAGRILVMDDDDFILDMVEVALKLLGYEAVTCRDGVEAVRLYRQELEKGAPFAAVIMDLTIPGGMGGKEAVAKVRELAPAAKVIVSSGYSSDPIMARYADYGFSGAVSKPYNVEQLGRALREVLGTAGE